MPVPERAAVPQRAVIVTPSTGRFHSRTYRIARTLSDRGHAVTVAARWEPGLPRVERHPAGYEIVRIGSPPHQRRVVRRVTMPLAVARLRRDAHARVPAADLYYGMAYLGIPIAADLARRAGRPLIYDAGDIYMEATTLATAPRAARSFLGALERRWAARADRVVTVNDAFADVLAMRLRVERPLVVLNCAYRYAPRTPREDRFHRALDLRPTDRVILYHGGFSPGRGVEELTRAIDAVPDAVLVLMGFGRPEEERRVREAERRSGGRVRVLPAVAPHDLLDWVASADVVAAVIQPGTLNHRLSTPNKLFEAIAAGVPVVVSDLPGMAPIVRDAECGLVVDPTDAAAIADALRAIVDAPTEARERYRTNALAAARDRYNWERQADVLLAEFGRLTGQPW